MIKPDWANNVIKLLYTMFIVTPFTTVRPTSLNNALADRQGLNNEGKIQGTLLHGLTSRSG